MRQIEVLCAELNRVGIAVRPWEKFGKHRVYFDKKSLRLDKDVKAFVDIIDVDDDVSADNCYSGCKLVVSISSNDKGRWRHNFDVVKQELLKLPAAQKLLKQD